MTKVFIDKPVKPFEVIESVTIVVPVFSENNRRYHSNRLLRFIICPFRTTSAAIHVCIKIIPRSALALPDG